MTLTKPKSLDFLITYVDDSVEEWKPSPKYEGVWLSNQGRVRYGLTFETSEEAKPVQSKHANFQIRHLVGGKMSPKHQYYASKDIADLFIPNPKGYTKVMYRDGNPKNCRVSNMTWSVPGFHSAVPLAYRTDNLSRYSMAKIKNATYEKLELKKKLEEMQRLAESLKQENNE